MKWFLERHCGGEEPDGVMPSFITFTPQRIPADGKIHFVTVNLPTSTPHVCVAAMSIDLEEGWQ